MPTILPGDGRPMPLSDTIKRFTQPGMAPITIFIGGDGQSFQRDYQILVGSPAVPEPLTGITVSAEIRTLDDQFLAAMTTAITDSANGWMRVTLSRATADAIPWPDDGPIQGNRAVRGRWHLRLSDGTASVPILSGPVTVMR